MELEDWDRWDFLEGKPTQVKPKENMVQTPLAWVLEPKKHMSDGLFMLLFYVLGKKTGGKVHLVTVFCRFCKII